MKAVNVALADADLAHYLASPRRRPRPYPNLALMKLATHYRNQGADVSFLDPLRHSMTPPDLLLVSKVFDYTPDLPWWPDCAIERGGTGYRGLYDDELLPAIEGCRPAYDFFGCDHAMGFTSRGCPNRCTFCVVPEKEGKARVVADLEDFWNGQSHVRILDPNLTALPEHFERLLVKLADLKLVTDLNQGLDARLLTADQARLLRKVRLWDNVLHLAWDRMGHEAAIRRAVGFLVDAGFSPRAIVIYVLVGYDTTPEEDVARVEAIRAMGCVSWVMPYQRPEAPQSWRNYITAIKRWGSRPQYREVPFSEYARGPWNTWRDLPWASTLQPY